MKIDQRSVYKYSSGNEGQTSGRYGYGYTKMNGDDFEASIVDQTPSRSRLGDYPIRLQGS